MYRLTWIQVNMLQWNIVQRLCLNSKICLIKYALFEEVFSTYIISLVFQPIPWFPCIFHSRLLLFSDFVTCVADDIFTLSYIVHSQTKNYKCPVCPKTFAEGGQLNEHKQSHTGELDCPYCGKSFRWKHSLREHIRAHDGNFSCFFLEIVSYLRHK